MEEHVFIALPLRRGFDIARATALDLDAAARFLLNVLHIGAAMANNLCSEVESRDGFQGDGNLLLGPFTLHSGLETT